MSQISNEELEHRAALLEDSLMEAEWDLESAEAQMAEARMKVHSSKGELARVRNILSDRGLYDWPEAIPLDTYKERVSARTRIKALAIQAGFRAPRINKNEWEFNTESGKLLIHFNEFDDGRESCYDVRRGKAHIAFVKLLKEEYGTRYSMTQHSDYGTNVWLKLTP